MKPKVSVILPSFNVADYIKECLNSVVSQSMRELEIICVDAESTDGTAEILKQYAKEDERITILSSDIKSYGRQVNLGLDYASGEYVAVLETDDWIASDMYGYLYEQGEADALDYIAADFDVFYQLQNGEYYFTRHHLFHPEQQGWYGKVLDSDHLATLRASDYVLWRGIYNRKFLIENHIRFHESLGAAFQDMGFLQQVKTCARRAKYLDQSFYRYRQDREGASSVALDGLRYYEQEFAWINNELKFSDILKGIHRKYYYFTMSLSFITKYEQILIKLNGDWKDKRLSAPYEWFRRQISNAVKSGLLDETMYEKELWKQLMLLLDSQDSYAKYVMDWEHKKRNCIQDFVNRINHSPVVIFGCGVRGERLMRFCDSNHIQILSFCDNNRVHHGEKKSGFLVISPDRLKNEITFENSRILLSMKNGREEVYIQLIKMGIESDRIIKDIPEVIL